MMENNCTDQWTVGEKLALVKMIAKNGQNWEQISKLMECTNENILKINRPNNWFSAKACQIQFKLLLDEGEKLRINQNSDKTAFNLIWMDLQMKKTDELRKNCVNYKKLFELKADIDSIDNKTNDEKLKLIQHLNKMHLLLHRHRNQIDRKGFEDRQKLVGKFTREILQEKESLPEAVCEIDSSKTEEMESVPAVKEKTVNRRTVSFKEKVSKWQTIPVEEKTPEIESVPAVKDKTPQRQTVRIVKEKSPEMESIAAVKDKKLERQTVPIVNEKSSEMESIAAVKDKKLERQTVPVVTEKTSNRRTVAVKEKSPEIESVPAVKEKTPEMESVPAVKEKTPEMESVSAVKEKTPEMQTVPFVNGITSEMENASVKRKNRKPIELGVERITRFRSAQNVINQTPEVVPEKERILDLEQDKKIILNLLKEADRQLKGKISNMDKKYISQFRDFAMVINKIKNGQLTSTEFVEDMEIIFSNLLVFYDILDEDPSVIEYSMQLYKKLFQ